jgi:hypothetical protein
MMLMNLSLPVIGFLPYGISSWTSSCSISITGAVELLIINIVFVSKLWVEPEELLRYLQDTKKLPADELSYDIMVSNSWDGEVTTISVPSYPLKALSWAGSDGEPIPR